MFNLDAINIVISLVGIATLSLGIVTIASDSKTRSNRFFLFFALSALAWITTMFFFRGVYSQELSLVWVRLLYVAAACIPITFLYFSFIVFSDAPLSNFKKLFVPIPFIFVTIIALIPGMLVRDVQIVEGVEKFIVFNPTLHLVYALYINGYFLWIYINLIQKYVSGDARQKHQLRFVIGGTVISTIFGVTSNLVLPLYGNFTYNWLGQVTVIFMVTSIFYAIVRHQLFNSKVIATEVFVFTLWGFILFRIFVSENTKEQLIDGLLLVATIIIGVLVIRSVTKEISSRERIEKLANELAVANDRLRELDKQKSEFVSIASHQLRSPLTAIKGYSSMILEKSFGEFSEKLKEPLERIFQSSERLVLIVEDFLNVSRIEQGRMQYDFATVKIDELAKGVIDELEPNVKRAGLEISFKKDEGKNYKITADQGKVRQVITNIIDNAIKYTPQGSISVSLNRDDLTRKVLLSIKDTGIGITEDAIPRLFQKFSRAEGASITNASGTGLGLYVAKEIMKAHRGNIWVDSEGPGRGSVFYLEFMGE